MAADRDLKKGDVYADIPESFTINREKLMETDLGDLVRKHPEIFDRHLDEDDMIFVIFYLKEFLKGKASQWNHMFNVAHKSDLPFQWE